MIRRLFANPGIKLLALSLAVVYWILVTAPRRERIFERTFDVPIAVLGVPRHLVITSRVGETVSVRLRGPATVLRGLSSQSLEATVDLSFFTKGGRATVTIPPSALNVPPDVEVVAIDPAKLTIQMEPRRQKVVPIRELIAGELPMGYEFGEITTNPPNALVSGPASAISELAEVTTERIFVTGRLGGFQRSVAVLSDDPRIQIVQPPTVRVTIDIIPPPAPPVPEATETTDATDTTVTSTSPP